MNVFNIRILLILLIPVLSCTAQVEEVCTLERAYYQVTNLKEVAESIKKYEHTKKGIYFLIEDTSREGREYFEIREMQKGTFQNSTWDFFYVDKQNCKVYYCDYMNDGRLYTPKEWDVFTKKRFSDYKVERQLSFEEFFNDISDVRFTPKDLNKDDPTIKALKRKLDLLDTGVYKPNEVPFSDLRWLINDNVFTESESFVDPSWLEYFITKYKFKQGTLNDLMKMSIEKENLLSLKTLSDGYIFSERELTRAKELQKKKDALKGKIDTVNFYDPKYSDIDEIVVFISSRFSKNHIEDVDGYTNLRFGGSTTTDIIGQITSGEYIKVIDSKDNWLEVETKGRKRGYVHRSRVKSE